MEETLKKKVINKTNRIEKVLLQNVHDLENDGLENGISGVAFYLFWQNRFAESNVASKDEIAFDIIKKLLTKKTNLIELYQEGRCFITDALDDFSKTGWLVETLVTNNFFEADTNELLESFDEIIIKEINHYNHHDILYNAPNYILYLAKRQRVCSDNDVILDALKRVYSVSINYLRQRDFDTINEFELFKAIQLISCVQILGDVDITLKKRTSECLTELCPLILKKLKDISENKIWNWKYMFSIICFFKISKSKVSKQDIIDFVLHQNKYHFYNGKNILYDGIMNGTAGNVFFYYYLLNQSKDKRLEELFDFWLNKLLEEREDEALTASFQLEKTQNCLGLQSGLSGIGLVLTTMVSEEKTQNMLYELFLLNGIR